MKHVIRVYIEDTDMMGIVYHGSYINYLERARTEFLHGRGLSLTSMAKDDTYFAVTSMKIDYKKSARLEEDLTVQTCVEKRGFCQAKFYQSIINASGELLLTAEIDVASVNKNMRPKRMLGLIFEE